MSQSFSDARERLRLAISSGVLARTDSLDDVKVKLFGTRLSVAFVEVLMALEEDGVKLRTVDDLMRFMDEMNPD
jgi:hypothetical protein